MIDDKEPLWAGIQDVGQSDGEAVEVPPDVIAKLVEFGLVQVVEGRPELTDYGEKAYLVLESGDGYIPELGEDDPALLSP